MKGSSSFSGTSQRHKDKLLLTWTQKFCISLHSCSSHRQLSGYGCSFVSLSSTQQCAMQEYHTISATITSLTCSLSPFWIPLLLVLSFLKTLTNTGRYCAIGQTHQMFLDVGFTTKRGSLESGSLRLEEEARRKS